MSSVAILPAASVQLLNICTVCGIFYLAFLEAGWDVSREAEGTGTRQGGYPGDGEGGRLT